MFASVCSGQRLVLFAGQVAFIIWPLPRLRLPSNSNSRSQLYCCLWIDRVARLLLECFAVCFAAVGAWRPIVAAGEPAFSDL